MASNGMMLPGQNKASFPQGNGMGSDVKHSQQDEKGTGKETAASLEHSLSTVHGIVPTLQ